MTRLALICLAIVCCVVSIPLDDNETKRENGRFHRRVTNYPKTGVPTSSINPGAKNGDQAKKSSDGEASGEWIPWVAVASILLLAGIIGLGLFLCFRREKRKKYNKLKAKTTGTVIEGRRSKTGSVDVVNCDASPSAYSTSMERPSGSFEDTSGADTDSRDRGFQSFTPGLWAQKTIIIDSGKTEPLAAVATPKSTPNAVVVASSATAAVQSAPGSTTSAVAGNDQSKTATLITEKIAKAKSVSEMTRDSYEQQQQRDGGEQLQFESIMTAKRPTETSVGLGKGDPTTAAAAAVAPGQAKNLLLENLHHPPMSSVSASSEPGSV